MLAGVFLYKSPIQWDATMVREVFDDHHIKTQKQRGRLWYPDQSLCFSAFRARPKSSFFFCCEHIQNLQWILKGWIHTLYTMNPGTLDTYTHTVHVNAHRYSCHLLICTYSYIFKKHVHTCMQINTQGFLIGHHALDVSCRQVKHAK